jgi:hypothetical protein
MKSIKSRILALLSSIGALFMGACGGACGVACLAGGCCGGTALFGLIGLSGSTLTYFEKLTPVFLVVTILSLSYAFYKAYKPKPADCCDTATDNCENSCCVKEKKTSFFQSKSFLWATTILCAIMWLYPYMSKINKSDSNCTPSSQISDSTVINNAPKIGSCCPGTKDCSTGCSKN